MCAKDWLPASLRSRLLSVGINPEGVLGLAPLERLEFLAEFASKMEALIDTLNEMRPWLEGVTAAGEALIERRTSGNTCESTGGDHVDHEKYRAFRAELSRKLRLEQTKRRGGS